MNPDIVVAVPLLSILALATSIDLMHRRIPNGLSLGGAAVGLVLQASTFGTSAFGLALLGWALCLVCVMPFYASGGMAAGDVKLMAMVGVYLGPMDGFIACMCTLVAGSALATAAVIWRSVMQRSEGRLQRVLSGASGDSVHVGQRSLDKIPYAAAIALGTLAAVIYPPWLGALFEVAQ